MMLDVAKNDGMVRPVSLASVAERTDLSRGYLEQLALSLRNARLLHGVSGRYGGYRLARKPEDITVGQILEATIGPVSLVDCIDDPVVCPRTEYCECRKVYSIINDRISEVLEEYSLADLMDPSWIHDQGGKQALLSISTPEEGNPGQGFGPGH